ncbi:MAG: hypothetical protein FWB78_02980 [Treponema sp.]|nr:hypothetical protein [Treponema sp.]
MKKKVMIGVALAAVLATGTAFADFGIGVYGGFGHVGGGGAGLTLAFSDIYVYIDFASGLAGWNRFHMSGAVDFITFLDAEIIPTLSWYIRLGIGAALWGYDRWDASELRTRSGIGTAAGVRVPIGVSWMALDWIEVFGQAIPQVGVRISGYDGRSHGVGLWHNFFGANIGVRFWL